MKLVVYITEIYVLDGLENDERLEPLSSPTGFQYQPRGWDCTYMTRGGQPGPHSHPSMTLPPVEEHTMNFQLGFSTR